MRVEVVHDEIFLLSRLLSFHVIKRIFLFVIDNVSECSWSGRQHLCREGKKSNGCCNAEVRSTV